jgi:hypothetical protein
MNSKEKISQEQEASHSEVEIALGGLKRIEEPGARLKAARDIEAALPDIIDQALDEIEASDSSPEV